jgi:hypothetical protein
MNNKPLSGGESIAGKRDAAQKRLINTERGPMSEGGSGTDYPTRNAEQTSLISHESGHNVTGLAAQLSEIVEEACGRQIAKGDFEGLLENITRACEQWAKELRARLQSEIWSHEKTGELAGRLRSELSALEEKLEAHLQAEIQQVVRREHMEWANATIQQLREELKEAHICEKGLREQIERYQEEKLRR